MALIEPLALALLAAALIPLALHLLVRRRGRAVRFPSLRFLEASPARRLAPGRLTHPWLLAVRVLLLALLALLLARPYGNAGAAARRAADRVVRVVVLDVSASMGGAGVGERARKAAREALADLDEGDRAALVRYAGRAWSSPTVVSPAAALAELDAAPPPPVPASPADEGSAHGAALVQALRVVAGVPGRHQVTWISDFRGADFEDLRRRATEAGAGWTSIPILPAERTNDAPAAVRLDGEAGAWRLRAAIDRFDERGARGEEIVWDLPTLRDVVLEGNLEDGRGAHVRLVRRPGRLEVNVALDPGDALPGDDVAAFSLELRDRVPVAVVGPGPGPVRGAIEAAVTVDGLNLTLDASPEKAHLLVVSDRSRLGEEDARRVREALVRGAAGLLGGAVRRTGRLEVVAPGGSVGDALGGESVEGAALGEPDDGNDVLGRFLDGSPAAVRRASGRVELGFPLSGPPGPALADGFPVLMESLLVELEPQAAPRASARSTAARLESAPVEPAIPDSRPAAEPSWTDPTLLEAETGWAAPLGFLLLAAALAEGWMARRAAVRR